MKNVQGNFLEVKETKQTREEIMWKKEFYILREKR